MHHRGKCLIVLIAGLCFLAPVACAQDRRGVLVEAHEISLKLEPEERLNFLIELAYDGPALALAADAVAWCEELYREARTAPILWNRSALAKNAALACSGINPKRAVEMLMAMDIPDPQPDGSSPEDVRADAAGRGRTNPSGPGENPPAIMETYYRKFGPSGLKVLRRLARYLGDTGEYPYDGWRFPLQDLRKRGDERTVNAIFTECIWYYRRGSRHRNESAVFIRLLRTAKDVVSNDLYSQAREVFLRFNPKFDFDAPIPPRRPWKIVVSESLNSRLQQLIKLSTGCSQVTEDDLSSFVRDAVVQVEQTYADAADQKHGLASAPGYNELVQLAHVWGQRNPGQLLSVVHKLNPSPHSDLLRAYMLLHLAGGMMPDPADNAHACP